MAATGLIRNHVWKESIMHVFDVSGMGCGSCVAKITKAIQQFDEHATVRVDRPQGKVEVESVESAEAVCQVITELGYPAVTFK